MKDSTYRTRIQDLRRIVIPVPICEALELVKGDIVEIKVRKVKDK